MTRFRKVPFVAWTVFLAVLMPGFSGLGESVLCFGVDGHVAFETAAPGGVCTSATGRMISAIEDAGSGFRISSQQDHCGPCVDVPVLVNEFGRGVTLPVSHKTNTVPVAWGTPAASAGPSMPGIQTAFLFPGIRLDLPDPTSISLRSTVLLI